jgi:acyl dehydratase
MINLFEDRHVLAQLGQTIGTSRWIAVPQQRITDFGHITEDPDLMHIDPAWAAATQPLWQDHRLRLPDGVAADTHGQ